MLLLRQATARTVVIGPINDETDGFTPETALTIAQADIRLSKNGGAFAQSNNSAGATHMENGYYSIPLDTTDTGTLGHLRVALVKETGARAPDPLDFLVVPAAVFDAFVSGTGNGIYANLQTAATGFDVYTADISVTIDNVNGQDEYNAAFYKNGAIITSGISAITIDVYNRADGTNLITAQTMTEIGSTEAYKYNETTNRLTFGEASLVKITCTIDAGTRTFYKFVTRDA